MTHCNAVQDKLSSGTLKTMHVMLCRAIQNSFLVLRCGMRAAGGEHKHVLCDTALINWVTIAWATVDNLNSSPMPTTRLSEFFLRAFWCPIPGPWLWNVCRPAHLSVLKVRPGGRGQRQISFLEVPFNGPPVDLPQVGQNKARNVTETDQKIPDPDRMKSSASLSYMHATLDSK